MQGKKSDRGKSKLKAERGRLGSKEAKPSSLDSIKKRKTSLSSEETLSTSAHTEFQVDVIPGIHNTVDGPSRKKRRRGGSHGGGGGHKKPKTALVEAVTVSVTMVPTLMHQDEAEIDPCTSGEAGCNPSTGSEVASATPVPTSEQETLSSSCSTRLGSVATAVEKLGTELQPSTLPPSLPALAAPTALLPAPGTSEKPLGSSESLPTWDNFVREDANVQSTPTTIATVVTVVSPVVDCVPNEAGSTSSPPDSPKLVIASPDPMSPPATQDVFVFPECNDTFTFSAVSLAHIKPTSVIGLEALHSETKQHSNSSHPERQQSEKKSNSISSSEKQHVEDKHSPLGEQQIENKCSGISLPERQLVENKQSGLTLLEKQHPEVNRLPNENISEKVKTQSEPKHCSITVFEKPEAKHCGVTPPERPTSLFSVAVTVASKPSQTEQVNKQTSKQVPANMAVDAISGGEGSVVNVSLPVTATTTLLGPVRSEAQARVPSASRLIPAEPGLGVMGQKTSVISVGAKSNGAGTPSSLLSPSPLAVVTTSTSAICTAVQSISLSPMLASTLGSTPTTTGPPPPPPTPRESPLLAMMASRNAAAAAAAESNSSAHPLSTGGQGPKSLSATPSPLLGSPSVHRLPKESDDVIITGESKKRLDSRKGLHSEMEHSKVPSLQVGDGPHPSVDILHNHHHHHHHHQHRGVSTQAHSMTLPVTPPTIDRVKVVGVEKQHGVGWEVQQDTRPPIPSPYLRHIAPSVPPTASVTTPTMATQFIPITYMTTDPVQLGFSMQQQQQQQQQDCLLGHLITAKAPLPTHSAGKYKVSVP